jgi:hypothetical protein
MLSQQYDLLMTISAREPDRERPSFINMTRCTSLRTNSVYISVTISEDVKGGEVEGEIPGTIRNIKAPSLEKKVSML